MLESKRLIIIIAVFYSSSTFYLFLVRKIVEVKLLVFFLLAFSLWKFFVQSAKYLSLHKLYFGNGNTSFLFD